MKRLHKASIHVLVVLWCVGCAATGQSAGDLKTALAWFVAPNQRAHWPDVFPGESFRSAPAVVIAWGPRIAPAGEAEAAPLPPKAVRERWIAAIQDKLARSGEVSRAVGTPPDMFDDGVALDGLRTLAGEPPADLIVMFSLDASQRRYHVSFPGNSTVYVASVIEARTTARAVGVTPAGRAVFAETRTGFDEGTTHNHSQVEEAAERAAVDALADAIVRRLDRMGKGRRS